MRDALIAVGLTVVLGPGVGQLYNREFRKGSVLIALALMLAGAMTVQALRMVTAAVRFDVETMDPDQLAAMIIQAGQALSPGAAPVMTAMYAAMAALWIWAAVDAYRGAKKRHALQLAKGDPR